MSSVDDRLRERDVQNQKEKDIKELELYNRYVMELRVLIPEIVKEIEADPPDGYKWLNINGKQVAYWPFHGWDSYNERNIYFSMLSNGQIMFDGDKYLELREIRNLNERPESGRVDSDFIRIVLNELTSMSYFRKLDKQRKQQSQPKKKHWWQ
jgi:hypothetical protein